MTQEQLQTLEQVIDEALDLNPGGSVRGIALWIRLHKRSVFDQNLETLGTQGLEAQIRARRKARDPNDDTKSSGSLCLDFGLPIMDLDTEVSVPLDMEHLPYSECEWKEPDDLTLDDIDRHIALLEAQGRSAFKQADEWRLVRQAAAKVARGRTDLTIKELRKRSRER